MSWPVPTASALWRMGIISSRPAGLYHKALWKGCNCAVNTSDAMATDRKVSLKWLSWIETWGPKQSPSTPLSRLIFFSLVLGHGCSFTLNLHIALCIHMSWSSKAALHLTLNMKQNYRNILIAQGLSPLSSSLWKLMWAFSSWYRG